MIGIWDDHDYGTDTVSTVIQKELSCRWPFFFHNADCINMYTGINDGGKTYSYRKESQQMFLDYFNEPKDSPRRKQEVRKQN